MMQWNYGYAPQPGPYGLPGFRAEVPLFEERGVRVTSARFVVYQQTYPIDGITSIAPFTVRARRSTPILLTCIGSLTLLVALVLGAMGGMLLGLLALASGIGWLTQCKATHGVMIATAGMNVRALTSQNFGLILRVVAALNQAVAMR